MKREVISGIVRGSSKLITEKRTETSKEPLLFGIILYCHLTKYKYFKEILMNI